MPENHFRKPGFKHGARGPFTKSKWKKKKKIQKIKETGDLRYIYQNELYKACFQRDMAYGDFKDLTRRTASDKYCMIKHLILLKVDVDLLQWFIKFLIKKDFW